MFSIIRYNFILIKFNLKLLLEAAYFQLKFSGIIFTIIDSIRVILLVNYLWNRFWSKTNCYFLRACSHGGGGPQVGEVPRLGGVTNLSTQSLFFSWLLSHERWGTLPRRVARSAVPGNTLRWGKFSPCECWRWGGVMFSWAFTHYKTNWKADRTAKNVKFNAQYFS